MSSEFSDINVCKKLLKKRHLVEERDLAETHKRIRHRVISDGKSLASPVLRERQLGLVKSYQIERELLFKRQSDEWLQLHRFSTQFEVEKENEI